MTIKDYKEEKTIKIRYFEIEGIKVKAHTLYEVLGGLKGCSGITRITIYNSDIAKLLEKVKAATKTARGSYIEGENFDSFYELIEEKIFN